IQRLSDVRYGVSATVPSPKSVTTLKSCCVRSGGGQGWCWPTKTNPGLPSIGGRAGVTAGQTRADSWEPAAGANESVNRPARGSRDRITQGILVTDRALILALRCRVGRGPEAPRVVGGSLRD